MLRRIAVFAALLVICSLATVASAASPDDPTVGKPAIEDLGEGHYRIGHIDVDRNAGRFSVPGLVIEQATETAPLEFVAGARGGHKNYEAALELDATAVEFNLACILIGLDPDRAIRPSYHFDPAPVDGDAVRVWLDWRRGGDWERVPAIRVLSHADADPVANDWVYTGSYFTQSGKFAAEEYGTLVGFVHDPESIIQHRTGLGLGNYGAVSFNREAAPPPGTPLTLTVERADPGASEASPTR